MQPTSHAPNCRHRNPLGARAGDPATLRREGTMDPERLRHQLEALIIRREQKLQTVESESAKEQAQQALNQARAALASLR